MINEFNELERELARYRPADVSDELMRQIQVQMHRPSVRQRHFRDYIFAATVAAGILATCINVTLLAASFRSGSSEPNSQPVMPAVQTSHGFEPTELALLQQQTLVEQSGGNASSKFMER